MASSVLKKGQPGSKARFKDTYLLHKLHSLSGIFPIGFYMIQHLVANSYALGPEGEARFNVVIKVFGNLPFVGLLEIGILAIPILFHAIYGVIITASAQGPSGNVAHYGYTRNYLYLLQRWSGVVAFVYIFWHSIDMSIQKRMIEATVGHSIGHESISYAAMAYRFAPLWYVALYIVCIGAASFHLGNGIFNFAIRWGIAIGKEAQKIAAILGWMIGIGLAVMGWAIAINFHIAGRDYHHKGAIEKQYGSVLDVAKAMEAEDKARESEASDSEKATER